LPEGCHRSQVPAWLTFRHIAMNGACQARLASPSSPPMRILIALLLPLLVASCGTAPRDSDYADMTNPCYRMHGNRTFKNGGDDISIYLGRVKSKGGRSWTVSAYHPFEIGNPTFYPWCGYAAGFGFSVPAVDEVTVSFNGMAPVRYRRLKLSPPGRLFTLETERDFWVPPSFPRSGFKVPELPQGDYRIQVRYRANGRELYARWHITYRPPGDYKAPPVPSCSIELRATKPGFSTTIRRESMVALG